MGKLTIIGEIVVAGLMEEIEVDGLAIQVEDHDQLRAVVGEFYGRKCRITFEWDRPAQQLGLPGVPSPSEAPHA